MFTYCKKKKKIEAETLNKYRYIYVFFYFFLENQMVDLISHNKLMMLLSPIWHSTFQRVFRAYNFSF